jgi:hypothetical protein
MQSAIKKRIMTEKDKADEICRKMLYKIEWCEPVSVLKQNAKDCALIAVNEIIEALREHEWQNRNVIDYYLEVKHEIELL